MARSAGVSLAGLAASAAWLGALQSASAQARPARPARTVDCARSCPVMVAVPAGRFTIGSPDAEDGRYGNEGPRRELAIGAFAISEAEVTRDQYARFARETRRPLAVDCPTPGDGSTFDADPRAVMGSWRDPGFAQTGRHPVVCVSWEDATTYAAWLTRTTGHHYRLPSEAEWEYAARGGTATMFFWGATADRACGYANGSDPSLVRALPAWIETVRRAARGGDTRAGILPCDDGHAFTAPVKSYRPNGFGLYDVSGNVWEHVADCWVAGGYQTLAPDGGARRAADCQQRRVRGGSWDDYAIDLRSARRTGGLSPTQRRNDTGFRVVRAPRPADARPPARSYAGRAAPGRRRRHLPAGVRVRPPWPAYRCAAPAAGATLRPPSPRRPTRP